MSADLPPHTTLSADEATAVAHLTPCAEYCRRDLTISVFALIDDREDVIARWAIGKYGTFTYWRVKGYDFVAWALDSEFTLVQPEPEITPLDVLLGMEDRRGGDRSHGNQVYPAQHHRRIS